MKLREYQQKAIDSIVAEWSGGNKSTLLVLPTGTGKTVVFAGVIRKLFPKRAMVLAHREELIFQAREKIQKVTGLRADIEMGAYKATMETDMFHPRSPVIVSTIQTHIAGGDGGGRMTKFNPMDFGLLIVDEAHHGTASSYKRVIDYYRQNPNLVVLGVTATPDRADEEALGQIFDTVAYDYEILDAIRDGWLVPIEQQMVSVDGLDFSSIRTTAGDLNGADLAEVMESEKNLHGIAGATIDIVGQRRGIGFASSVEQARQLAEIFNRHKSGMASWVCGKTDKDDRKRIIADFAAGKIQFVWNCGVFTEGFDDSGVDVISMARPTKSRALYGQMAGRATRPHESIAHQLNNLPVAALRRGMIARSCKPSCILEGQRVLTDVGLVPIEKVTTQMKVWDGLEFVTHSGIIFRGERNIIEYAGLKATADHKVWTQKGWQTFGRCASEQIAIAVTGYGGKEIRETDRYFSRGFQASPNKKDSVSFDAMRLRSSVVKRIHQSNSIKGWMQKVWASCQFSKMALAEVCRRAAALPKQKRFIVCSVWRSRYPIQLFQAGGYGEMGDGKSWIKEGTYIRQDKQQWSLRTGKSSLRNEFSAAMKSASKEASTNADGSQFQNGTPGNKIFRRNIAWSFFGWLFSKPNNRKIQEKIPQTKGRVWDILNAGPRHRFTVEGLLVSNCLILDFVGNSGRHKLMTTADILGGNVSDEVVQAATEFARKAGKPVRMAEVLEDEEKKKEERKKRELEEAARKARLVAKTSFKTQKIDPFDVLAIKPVKELGWNKGKVLKEGSKKIIRSVFGLDPTGMEYGRGMELVKEFFRRKESGECTFGQAKILKKYGYDVHMKFDSAKTTIDAIAKNGWRRPAKPTVVIPKRPEKVAVAFEDDVPF